MRKRSVFMKVFSVLVSFLFLFNTCAPADILYHKADTLAAPNNVLDNAEGGPSIGPLRSLGEYFDFRKGVRSDMKAVTLAMFLVENIRPWELEAGADGYEAEVDKRLNRAKRMLRPLLEKKEAGEILSLKVDLDNVDLAGVKAKHGLLTVPFKDFDIVIGRKQDIIEMGFRKPLCEFIGAYGYTLVLKKPGSSDLKGTQAGEADPLIMDLIAKRARVGDLKIITPEEKIVEITVDTRGRGLKANRVKWVGGYKPGLTPEYMYMGREVNIEQLFPEKAVRDNITGWIRTHKIRGKPVKIRVVAGAAGIGWASDTEHANIAHAGIKDGVIYMGSRLLSAVMRPGEEKAREELLDNDEYRHLKGLGHGSKEDVLARIGMAGDLIKEDLIIEKMVKNEEVGSLFGYLKKTLTEDDIDGVLRIMAVSNDVSLANYKFPVESRYPVKKAVALLDKEEQRKLVDILKNHPDTAQYRHLRIVDEILLMLNDVGEAPGWIEEHAPGLIGRNVWQVSPEIWHEAGGLSRVMQYHGAAMQVLIGDSGTELRQVEPHYQYRINPDGQPEPFSYETDITHPFRKLEHVTGFNVTVQGREVRVEVHKGVNDLGIETYLIRDVDENGESFYTHSLYNYSNDGKDLPTWKDFSVFYSKASLELIRHVENLEKEKKSKAGEEWKAPFVHTNDSQTALFSVYAAIERDTQEEKREQDPEFVIDPVLEEMIIGFTTHTYINRMDYTLEEGYGDRVMEEMDIPFKYRELFKRIKENRHVYDMACGGLRSSDWQGVVSRDHGDGVRQFDEWVNYTPETFLKELFAKRRAEVRMIAVSNGDNRKKSAEVFRRTGRHLEEENHRDFLEGFNPDQPTPEQIIAIKEKAKQDLRLDRRRFKTSREEKTEHFLEAGQPVISYSGRLVPEKAGRQRAFTDENLEFLVRKGVQVVIYGNVQTKNPQSTRIKEEFETLIERFREKNYPGALIFVPRFSLDEQRALLAATDIQVQDSDKKTEAAGYTESAIAVCGGLQMTTPRAGNGEGLLKAQGLPISLEEFGNTVIHRGVMGNTLIPVVDDPADPSTWSRQAYLEVFSTVLGLKEENPDFDDVLRRLSIYQASSVRMSRVVDAKLTAAEYLRQFSMASVDKPRREKMFEMIGKEWAREEEARLLAKQLEQPDHRFEKVDYAVYEVTRRISDEAIDDAVLFFLTNALINEPMEYRKLAVRVCNNFLKEYFKDGRKGELLRRFINKLNVYLPEITPDKEDFIPAVKDIQLITGQALTVMSWVDRHVPGAENIRLTDNQEKMVTSKKGNSFIEESTLPSRVPKVEQEGAAGFFWRGTEGVKKIGKNILKAIFPSDGAKGRRVDIVNEKLVLYLMDHGFIEVPETLKPLTPGRVTTMHETFFLNGGLASSSEYVQMTSTGPGHFQGRGLDIKYVTEGSGVQVNVLYGEDGRIIETIAQEITEGDWALALPGYVDYMINTGQQGQQLRFNDISVTLTDGEARMLNPRWEMASRLSVKPEYAPVVGYFNAEGKRTFVLNRDAGTSSVTWIGQDSYRGVAGRMFSLFDVYAKLGQSRDQREAAEKIHVLVDKFAKEHGEAIAEATARDLISSEDLAPGGEKPVKAFDKAEGVKVFLEDNRDMVSEIMAQKEGALKVIRIARETLDLLRGSGIISMLNALQDTGAVAVELFSVTDPYFTVESGDYKKYGLEYVNISGKGAEIGRSDIMTVLPVQKGMEFAPSGEHSSWESLGLMWNGERCQPGDSIIMPVGLNYDTAGVLRSIFLGLRLMYIAENDFTQEDPFVKYTLSQYRDFCVSQGVPADLFTLNEKDVVALAGESDLRAFTDALNRLIRTLPIVPMDVDKLRMLHEIARDIAVKA